MFHRLIGLFIFGQNKRREVKLLKKGFNLKTKLNWKANLL